MAATKKYDALIAGGGTGRDIAVAAERLGRKVALVEKSALGGTRHNRGCMPSKMLIQSADVLETERGSGKFGIASRVDAIEFPAIVRTSGFSMTRRRSARKRCTVATSWTSTRPRESSPAPGLFALGTMS